ncbi:MAG: phosphate/phosphite/phosphonate ABC transporter substrate-binding protein [Candidatus Riflebacteria bacterium]|nr:phosphate/phosphite/phosphonate ABC transporter substrate-binding protein [Candidatus Riflebacteria bacterium]
MQQLDFVKYKSIKSAVLSFLCLCCFQMAFPVWSQDDAPSDANASPVEQNAGGEGNYGNDSVNSGYDSSSGGGSDTGTYDNSSSGGSDTGTYDSSSSGGSDTGTYDSSTSGGSDTSIYDSSSSGGYDTGAYDSSYNGSSDAGPYDSSSGTGYDTGTYDSSSGGGYDTGAYDSSSDGGYDTGAYDSTSGGNSEAGGYDGSSDGYYGNADGNQQSPAVVENKVKPRPSIKLEEKTIRIGRIPYRSVKEMMDQAVRLSRFIKKESGVKEVRLVSAKTYSKVLDALVRDNIDFAWISPTAFVSRQKQDKLMAVAKAQFASQTSYRGVFITYANSKVYGVNDVKGRSIAFVDPNSASGYIYPLYVLKRLGINPHKDCSSVKFLESHDKVLQAVIEKKIDLGVCLEQALKTKQKAIQEEKIVILGKTDEVPSDVIVCRQDCPENLREKFLEALLKINTMQTSLASGTLEVFPFPTFLKASDEDYEFVKTVVKAVSSVAVTEK